MSTICGIWSKTNPLDQFVDVKHFEKLNNWWDSTFTCKLKTEFVFFAGAYMNVEEPRLCNKDLQCDQMDIICDARLDNRSEIQKLIKNLSSDSPDIEHIASLYLRYGENCLDYLKGAFSFVIYDKVRHCIFCAVDHLGVKTLHYSNTEKYFSFGTQKKCVLAPNDFDRSPNWNYLAKFILFYQSEEKDSEYRFVSRLPAGTSLLIRKDNSVQKKRYWSLDTTKTTNYKNDSDYEEQFLELAENAVKVRMRGVPKIATHLSGGLDSSGITGIASHLSSQTNQIVEAFGYTIPDNVNKDRLQYAFFNPLVEKQAEFSNIKVHQIQNRIFRTLREVIEYETKCGDGFSVLNKSSTEFEIQHAIQKSGFQVALSGFLGDALVTSFAKPFNLEYLENGSIAKYFRSDVKNNLSYINLIAVIGLKGLNKMNVLSKDKIAQIFHSRTKNKYAKAKQWVDHLFDKDLFINERLHHVFKNEYKSEYLYGFPFTLKEYQKNHVQRRFTSARMEAENAAGLNFKVQYRYPYADIDLLQYVLSLPVQQKIRPNQTRSIYRRSMKKYIHEDILRIDNKDGHIKPMVGFFKEKTRFSLKTMYYDLKEMGHLDYLDLDKIDSYLNNNFIPPHFNYYLTYGELMRQGKMKM